MAVADVRLKLEGLRQRPSSSEQLQAVADALLGVLQVGLKGNRAVGGSVWSVVTAATRAYPIQLSPSVEKAQIVVDACPGAELVQTWALQAVADGSFIILLQRLAAQPQIVTAYAKDATVRDAKAIEQLVSLLEELKGLVAVAPYDSYMQRRPSESAAAPVHIQTEEDLLQQRHHQQQQHQSPVSEAHQDDEAARSATEQQPDQTAGISQTQQVPALTVGKPQALVRLFQRNKRDKTSASSSSSSNTAASLVESREQQQMQPAHQDPEQPLLVRVQLQVSADDEVKAGSAQHQVHLQLQVLTEHGSNTAASNISRTSTGHSSSSSSRLLGAGAGAVKGMFHSLQQSASAGLHHSAAAGQELGGAVAAAGEAAFGAITQPFAAVKGLASRAGSRKPTVNTDVSAVIPQAPGEVSDGDKDSDADPAAGSSGVRAVPSFFSRRPSSTAAAAAARATGRGVPAAPDSSSNSCTAEGERYGTAPVLQVQLHVAADASHPVQLVVKLLPEAQESGSRASSIHLPRWTPTKGLLGRIGMGRSSSSSHKGCTSDQLGRTGESAAAGAAAGKGLASVPSAAAAASDEQSRIEEVLEGDMWSVMQRLKHTAGGMVPGHGTDATGTCAGSVQGGIPAATSPAAAAAAEQAQLQQQGHVLLQQLLDCCHDVGAAAAATRGCLGDEIEAVLQLVELIKALLNHGLRHAPATAAAAGAGDSDKSAGSSGKAAAAKEALGGWLQSGKSTPAFGALQALQHGSKQHPRLMLGADGIANMKAAKSSSAAVKLDMWVRASLNEQLLGVRLSTLVANAAALGTWYNSQALLLQQQLMQPLLQQVSQLCDHKFALLVGTPPANTTSTFTSGSADSSGAPSSSFVIPNPSKLLGSFSSFGRGVLPGFGGGTLAATGSSGDSTGAASSAAAATAAAVGVAGSAGGTSGSSSSSSIPTFLWSALSSAAAENSGTTAAAGPAAGSITSSGAASGLFRRRRVAPIKEVRVPPPDSAEVLSPDASCALSPVSTAGDAAYAEWWSPNSSWQDFGKAEGLEGNARDDIGDGGGVWRNSSASGSGGGAVGLSTGGPSSADVCWDDAASLEQQQRVWLSSRQQVGSSEALTSTGSVQSEAALKLEQELAAAISAPVANMVGGERTGRTSSGAGSSGSSSRGSSGHKLHRSSSAGWEAAVARARSSRAYSASNVCVGLGAVGPQHRPLLQRRSRSPDASWPAAAPSEGGEAVGSSGAGRRVRGHMHKRSSSLNDLPELQALFDSGDLLQRH